MRVAAHTLGCKVNQYDTEAMLRVFRQAGYDVVDFDEVADVYLINTCTVTHEGDRKSRQLVRRARRRNPGAVVVVAGCYAQTSPGEVAGIEGVSLVLGNRDKGRVAELVEEAREKEEVLVSVGNIFQAREFEEIGIDGFGGRTRAAVKIQDGCNEFCTFCIIPYARGTVRSRAPEQVRSEVKRLARAGFQEVVLTGIHLGAYGRDLPGKPGLALILEKIHEVPGIRRIRLSSLEPMDAGDGVIQTMARLPKVARHLHLPVQSGSDPILQAMRRHYTTGEFRSLVAEARRLMPGIAITTDVMVGFPGETEELFAETLAFVEEIGFSRLHVFPFSPRKGTKAATMPGQVPGSVKSRRVKRLLELGDRLAREYHSRWIGREVEVLVEEELSGEPPREAGLAGERGEFGVVLNGLTDNYIRVFFEGREWWPGRFVRVRITGATAEGAWGRVVAAPEGSAVPGSVKRRGTAERIARSAPRGQVPELKVIDW